jgi:hypothetical protein
MADHPLQNPTTKHPQRVSLPLPQMPSWNKEITLQDLQQYALPINQPQQTWQTRWQRWLSRWQRQELELQLMPVWRGAGFPFALVTAVLAGPGLILASAILFGRAGARIPIVYNPRSSGVRWESAEKIMLILIPVVVSILLTIILRLVYRLFNYDHRLASLLSWLIVLFNMLFMVAAVQIYSLVVR